MYEKEDVVVTAEELRELTREAMRSTKTREEKLEAWWDWFLKRGPGLVRESVKRGYFRTCFDLPFQPLRLPSGDCDHSSYRFTNGRVLSKRIREMFPGCSVEYVEEESDEPEGWVFILEISWSAGASNAAADGLRDHDDA
jgi:hypothetical protein